jgi:hypothetical protein
LIIRYLLIYVLAVKLIAQLNRVIVVPQLV